MNYKNDPVLTMCSIFASIILLSCVTNGGKTSVSSDEISFSKNAVVEYISQMNDAKKRFRSDPCTDQKAWWCVAREFSEEYHIDYADSSYGYIFFKAIFYNNNLMLFVTENVDGKWQVVKLPIKAGEGDVFITTHGYGKKFKVLGVKFEKNGKIVLKDIRE